MWDSAISGMGRRFSQICLVTHFSTLTSGLLSMEKEMSNTLNWPITLV